jgi:dual specificity phosphatase 12
MYVHCTMGFSRSPTIILAYLMYKYGYTLTRAMNHVRKIRYIGPNEGFTKQLMAYENYLNSVCRKS